MLKIKTRKKIELAPLTKSNFGDTPVTELEVGDKFEPLDLKDCEYMEIIAVLKETPKMVHFTVQAGDKVFKQSFRKTSSVNLVY